jgi:hypothetical protein
MPCVSERIDRRCSSGALHYRPITTTIITSYRTRLGSSRPSLVCTGTVRACKSYIHSSHALDARFWILGFLKLLSFFFS